MNLIERCQMVLVEPSEAGNVGAACRALMNCGFGPPTLVRPQNLDWAEARRRAVHAAALVEQAPRCAALEDALAGAHWVVGVSARARSHPERKPVLGPDGLIERLAALPAGGRAALLFGPERSGLTNAQLGRCQDVVRLPTADAYPSLNLAHAVLLIAWTVRRADLAQAAAEHRPPQRTPVPAASLAGLMEHAARTLQVIGYLNPQNPRLVLDDLRHIFARAQLDERELGMVRGIFHRMDVWIERHGGPPTPNQRRAADSSEGEA